MGYFSHPYDTAAVYDPDNEKHRTELLSENGEAVENYLRNLANGPVFSYPGAVATGTSGIWVPHTNQLCMACSLGCGTRTTATTTVKFWKNGTSGTLLATLSLNGKTVSNVAVTSNVATITTSAAHGFSLGDIVTISGLTHTALNGSWSITSLPSSTTFTFNVNTANVASVADSGPVGQIYTSILLAPPVGFLARQDFYVVQTTVAGAGNSDLTAVFEVA